MMEMGAHISHHDIINSVITITVLVQIRIVNETITIVLQQIQILIGGAVEFIVMLLSLDDGYTNRQTQNRSTNNNNYNNRNNYNRNEVNENSVTIQSLVTDPESKKIVEEYRKNLIKDFQGSTSGSLENEKIVYVVLAHYV